MQVLPGVLAVGEHLGSSGRDMLAAFVLGYDVAARLAGGFTPRPLAHQNGQVSLLAAAARGSAPPRARRGRHQPRHAHRDDIAADAELYQRSGRRDGAQCRRRDERLCGSARPRTGPCRFRGAGRRDRAGARRSGRKRLHARTPARRPGHGLAHYPQLLPALCVLQPDPPGARLPSGGAGARCTRSRTRSSGSTLRPTGLLR